MWPSLTPDSELEYVQRALGGDPDAWDALFSGHLGPYIHALVGRAFLPGHPDLYEEAVLEAIYQIYAHLGQFRGQAKLTTWSYYYVLNAIAKGWQSLRRNRLQVPVPEGSDHPTPAALTLDVASDIERRLQLKQIDRALADMGPAYRETFELTVLDGLAAADVALRQGVSLHTVKSRLARARKRLRRFFGQGR